MKDRQRWQPEEDALIRAYVSQYGPKEWHLISQRMSKPLHRDPKSCLERWKNYLKPGIKKGSLTPQEQTLVISLQAKYGNKWKKIASEVPGRTAKRLGKWWEVFKEKQVKQLGQSQTQSQPRNCPAGSSSSASNSEKAIQGTYDHILETFAEKYVQPYLSTTMPNLNSPILSLGSGSSAPPPLSASAPPGLDPNVMVTAVPTPAPAGALLPWMNSGNNNNNNVNVNNNNTSSSSSKSTTPSPSVSLTLSPSEPVVLDPVHSDYPVHTRFFPVQKVGTLVQYCKEVEEAKQNWVQHKKEATWRLSRLEQQLEAEKNRKRREKMEDIEAKIRCLREEETTSLMRMENEYREQLNALQKDAQGKEVKLIETWSNKQMKISKVIEQINGGLIQHQQHMINGNNHHHHHHG